MKLSTSILWVVILSVLAANAATARAESRQIYILEIKDAISPGVADHIRQGLSKASKNRAACVIIILDTPGGLVESMRQIVMDIYESEAPVAVYVSPGGARAASAGVMITMAADIAAMAPGTHIGAAHPVGIGGKEVEGAMSDKVLNDMVAQARSIAQKRDRNLEWAEKAVRESVSVTETEALKEGVIDLVAKDLDDLIRQMNGRPVAEKGILDIEHAERVLLKENFRTRVLRVVSNPNIAYILLMIGMAGLYFELSHPGAIFPGVIGGISLVLALYSLQTLPVNIAGILLIVLALIFFILEMKVTSFGLLSVAGVVSLLLGSLMLFEGERPDMRVSWGVLLPTVAVVSGFFILVAGMVFKAQVTRPKTGREGLVGELGEVKEEIAGKGKVMVHGELWKARSDRPIKKGSKVRVVKVDGLVVTVEEET